MTCPHCGSARHERHRSPRERDQVVLRRHRCLDCGQVFVSAQIVVTETLASRLINTFREEPA